MGWLTSLQGTVAGWIGGGGLVVALVFAILSVAIALGVAMDRWAVPLLWLSIAMNLVLWVVGQGFGLIFAGGATDPNAGPCSSCWRSRCSRSSRRASSASAAETGRPPRARPGQAGALETRSA